MLYDGHGSTRQLVTGSVGSTVIVDDFSYDGYGVLLQAESVASANPGKTLTQATSLLYAGEMFDFDSQHYYNRARWYNSYNGLFNRTDPFAGNMQDPQSLHKYLYAHCNPINGIDPTGEFFIGTVVGFVTMLWAQAKMLGMRTADAIRVRMQYSRAKKILTAIAVASVIASSFVSNYIEGAAELELPFGNQPMLKKWPNIKFAIKGNLFTLDVRYSTPVSYTSEPPTNSRYDLKGGGSGSFNFETGKFEGFEVDTGLSIRFYKKGPIEASISGKFELPAAFKLGLGLSFSSSWDPLSFGADFSLLKADKSGIAVLWGISWK